MLFHAGATGLVTAFVIYGFLIVPNVFVPQHKQVSECSAGAGLRWLAFVGGVRGRGRALGVCVCVCVCVCVVGRAMVAVASSFVLPVVRLNTLHRAGLATLPTRGRGRAEGL